MPNRLPINKTPKCYVGGAFIRSESARVFPIENGEGGFFANIPQCSRKDLRNAVEAAAKAGPGWAKRSAYNRGQILYRLAEMLEARSEEMQQTFFPKSAADKTTAAEEVEATIDRVVYYAGWVDKYEQVLGNVNAVASPHFNFTVTEPMGIIGIIAPDDFPLLGLVSLILPAIVSGNAVAVLASSTHPYPAIVLGEMLATSDLPGGVVNLLTGFRQELLPTFASHEHIRALSGVLSANERELVRHGAAESVKRLRLAPLEEPKDWMSDQAQSVYEIQALVEYKTVWHPIGA